MNALLIDLGNTSCKYALSSGTSLVSIVRDDGSDILRTVSSLLGGSTPDVVVLSSVREGDPELLRALGGACGKLIVLDHRTPMPISIRYGTPGTLGADRLAAAAGARSLFPGSDILIFDFGTALTIDRVTSEGVFAGGNISAGMHTRLRALNMLTGRLPLVEPAACCPEPGCLGCSTVEALTSGAVSGTVFEVEGYINRHPGHKLIFTGGDSLFFVKRMKNPIFAICNLVLTGLAHIAEYNAHL